MTAVVAPMSITAGDGTVLDAPSDLQLSWKWAAHEYGPGWRLLPAVERWAAVRRALLALRDAYEGV